MIQIESIKYQRTNSEDSDDECKGDESYHLQTMIELSELKSNSNEIQIDCQTRGLSLLYFNFHQHLNINWKRIQIGFVEMCK